MDWTLTVVTPGPNINDSDSSLNDNIWYTCSSEELQIIAK